MLNSGWSRCAPVGQADQRVAAAGIAAWVLAVAAVLAASVPARSAGTLFVNNGFGGRMLIREHTVRVEVQDGIALTEVTQVFDNPGTRIVEGMYKFPLPPGASLADFTMWINGKEMVGEVVERQRARRVYESYKPVARDPGLLEKVADNLFEMRIFPINPQAAQKVRVRYYQELPCRDGKFTYTYPLQADLPDSPYWDAKPQTQAGRFSFQLSAHSRLGIVAMASPTHPALKAEQRSEVYWQAGMDSTDQSLGRNMTVTWTCGRKPDLLEVFGSRTGEAVGTFRAVITLGEDLPAPPSPGQDFVYLLDASGSMNDDARIDRARALVNQLLARLGPNDTFTILAAGPRDRWLSDKLVSADGNSIRRAKEFLALVQPRGSLVLEPALAAAADLRRADRPFTIVLLSDGILDFDEPGPLSARLTRIGLVGRLVHVALTRRKAGPLVDLIRKDVGWIEHLPPDGDVSAVAGRITRQLAAPALLAPGLEWAGVEVSDVAPARLAGLWPGESVSVYGRYRGPGKLTATLRGRMNGRQITRSALADLPACDHSKGRIERMWASRRIDDLSAQADAQTGQDQQDTLWKVVRLGELYSVVTDYTSFLVLENDAEFRKWQIQRSNALRLAWDTAGDGQARQQLAALNDSVKEMSSRLKRDGVTIQPQPNAQSAASGTQVGDQFVPELPKPTFCGTPKNIREKNLRPFRTGPRKITLPEGVRVKNVARGKPVTSSDMEPIIGELKQLTDGDKAASEGSYVEIGPGRQWVQIDLGEEQVIRFLLFWHYHGEARVYHDVIVQVSDDPEFILGVTTLFNNDYDNSSGMGIGKDMQYIDSYEGELVMPPRPVLGRYVRLWSNGNTSNDQNHYTEVEVYASPPE